MITGKESEIINRTEFEQFFDEVCVGEFEILDELIADLKAEGQDLVNAVINAFETENLSVLNRSAHTLKSSTKIFGSVYLSQQAAQIELLSNPDAPGDFGTVADAVGKIQEDFTNFLVHLDSVVDGKRSG